MPFSRLSYEKSWTSEEDFPTYEGNEEQVRADMQYHPDAVKKFINETLLKELEEPAGAGKIGDEREGNLAQTLTAIYGTLESHAQDIVNLAAGDAPESVRSAQVAFTAGGWSQNENTGLYELHILQSQHKRLSGSFGYRLESQIGTAYKGGTWETACTAVDYDEGSQDVVLTAENAYAGSIIFFGV